MLAPLGLAGAQLTTPAKAKASAQSSATLLPLHIQRPATPSPISPLMI
ncbi:hypothetical protein [Phaeobacter inhibens]|nr:hypothetical protein [Phaeobacter inhibens]